MNSQGKITTSFIQIFALVLKRILSSLVTLFLVSLVIFFICGLLPGDAAQEILGQSATVEQVKALRHEMGLDRSAFIRYTEWLFGIMRGDLGQSLVANMPVKEIIAERLPNTLKLAGFTTLFSVPIALFIGIISAIKRGKTLDKALNVLTLSMVAMPEFLVATLGVLIFSVKLLWLPSIALIPKDANILQILRALALPIASLSVVVIAQMARMTRAAVADQLDQPYVEMARLKGVPFNKIIISHVLPNTISPIVNAMALSLSYLMGGAIIVETIFNYSGLASLMVNAVTSRDMPLLQACATIFCSAYLALMLIADIFSIIANPRLRAQ